MKKMIAKPIIYNHKFQKSLITLSRIGKLKERILIRINLFLADRSNPILRDHSLQGRFKNFRAFSITGDVRIIYREYPHHFLFIDIGTHNQVYS
ncbi:MAG: type II toxin-antitoxin system YafQ family toxin [bacterium]